MVLVSLPSWKTNTSPAESSLKWLEHPIAHVTKLAGKPYQLGVKLNETVSLLAAWKHVRNKLFKDVKELTPAQYKQAFDETIRITSMSNNTLGRINRLLRSFGNEKPFANTVAQSMNGLMSYVANDLRQPPCSISSRL